ncbi:MAG: type II toxin-antitoxin system HipA family toxin [Flavobacterium sp.]|nr:type II toxin-antitoxin system HipA family toxin [Flavobacterium sp.]
MIAISNITIWKHKVGVLLWDELQNLGIFEFDKNFTKFGLDLSPLVMPINELRSNKNVFSFPDLNFEKFYGLPGIFSESLPDGFGNKIIDLWFINENKNQISPINKLGFIGSRGIGALHYENLDCKSVEIASNLKIPELIDFVNSVAYNSTFKYNEQLFQITTVFSGKNPKAIVSYNPKTNNFRSGTINNFDGFEYWLIKLDLEKNDSLKIEFAYHLMAKDCGIETTVSRMFYENGHSHLLSKRFDRDKSHKVHVQSLCGLAHFENSFSKVNSFEHVFEVLRQLKMSYISQEELFRRIVFNLMSRNQNYTSKKISFLIDSSGKWKLAPAYGLSFDLLGNADRMSINQKTENIILDDLLMFAKKLNIKKPKKIIERCNEVLFNWMDYAQLASVNLDKIRKIDRELIVFDL